MTVDYSLLKRLCDIPGPAGFEDDVRDMIQHEIAPYVDQLYSDPMGNLIAVKGKSSDILFDAHMDEVGFMITGVSEDGTLRFNQIGSITANILPGKRVLIGKNRIPGVIGATPTHLIKNDPEKICYDTLSIYIGAESRSEAERYTAVGDFAVFDTECHTLAGEHSAFASRNMDDRLGCYLLIELIRNDNIQDCTFVFSVQEETGDRGAAAAAEELEFRYGIAIDTTSAANIPGVKEENQVCAIGKGGVLSFIDRMTTYDNALIREVYDHISGKGIPVQTKGRNCGGTNASVYQKIGVGHLSLSLSTPALFIHGPLSIVLKEDIESMERAMIEIYRLLTHKTDKEGEA